MSFFLKCDLLIYTTSIGTVSVLKKNFVSLNPYLHYNAWPYKLLFMSMTAFGCNITGTLFFQDMLCSLKAHAHYFTVYIYVYIYVSGFYAAHSTTTFGVRKSILNWVSKTQSLKRKKGKRYLKFQKAFLICNNLLKINFRFLIASKSMKTLRFYTFKNLWCCMMHVMC